MSDLKMSVSCLCAYLCVPRSQSAKNSQRNDSGANTEWEVHLSLMLHQQSVCNSTGGHVFGADNREVAETVTEGDSPNRLALMYQHQ